MSNSVGLLSNRVKKVPSTEVPESRYKFLRLGDSEPDLGVPPETNYVLSSDLEGNRFWISGTESSAANGEDGQLLFIDNGSTTGTENLAYRKEDDSIDIHSAYNLRGSSKTFSNTDTNILTSFSAVVYGSASITIQAYDTVTGERQTSELLIVHNSNSADATEFGVVFTGTEPIATFDVQIDSSEVLVTSTNSSSNETEFKTAEKLIKL